MTVWLALFEPGQIKLVWLRTQKRLLGRGYKPWWIIFLVYGFYASKRCLCKSVGQIELIFSLLITTLFFKERILNREILGMLLIGISAIGLILVV